jgi:predicted RNase H-like HicB family nuclease
MKYVYTAVFRRENDNVLASVPELHAHTFGNDIPHAIRMIQDAISMVCLDDENDGTPIPDARSFEDVVASLEEGEIAGIVVADTDAYRRLLETKVVKKTLSIPAWLNREAEKANAPFSKILQDGLRRYLNITDR